MICSIRFCLIFQVKETEKDEQIASLFGSDTGCEMLESIGYRGVPSRATINKDKQNVSRL